jgi:predicted ATPase
VSHPFGDLLTQHLHRKHGLSQAKLAAGILQAPSIISEMCQGKRLRGSQARERVTVIIAWLQQQGALTTLDEANALLSAAGLTALRVDESAEAALLRRLTAQPVVHPRLAATVAHAWHGNGEQLRHGSSQVAPLSSEYSRYTRPRHNLPAQTMPLIGRAQELVDLALLLATPTTRLVTILGAGGMGKSHLAVAAATDQAERFADGVCWVELAPLSEASELVLAIGNALGLQFEGSRRPEQQIGDFLHTKHLLLVLDNFEHILEGAPFVGELLTKAPQLSMLITSRQRLKLSSETVLLLDGLPFPTEAGSDAFDSPAVQLFLRHARHVQPYYQPNAQELAGIVQICRLVAGMPLGILLASAWTDVISPSEIAAEISQDLGFLHSDLQDIPARQRNLRALFLHTWSRMSIAERDVFMRLSVFRGGVTRDAAQRVTGATIAVLAALSDKALLWRLPDGRYELHELLRQFAAEQLMADGGSQGEQQRQAHWAHSHFYLTLLGEQEGPLQGQDQRAALDLIRADFENITVAWRWAVQQHEFTLLAPAIHALFLDCEIRGNFHEGVSLFAAAAAELTAATSATNLPELQPLLKQMLMRLGACEVLLTNHKSATNHLEQALGFAMTDWERAFTLAYLGRAATGRGERPAGRALLDQSLVLSRRCQDPGLAALVLFFLSNSASAYTEAVHVSEESLALWRQAGRPDRIAYVLGWVAWYTCCLGDYAQASAYWLEGIPIYNALGMQSSLAWALDSLGFVAWCQGDLPTAQSYLQEAAALYRSIGAPSGVGMCLAELALVSHASGASEEAVALARQGVAILRDTENLLMLIVSLYALGSALIGTRDFAAARQALHESCQLALVAQLSHFVVNTFYYFAELLVLESHGADLSLALECQSLAVALLSCVRAGTSTWQIYRDKAAHLQAEIAEILPIDLLTAAIARGQNSTLEEMAATILEAGAAT